jgi:hypothetical protein
VGAFLALLSPGLRIAEVTVSRGLEIERDDRRDQPMTREERTRPVENERRDPRERSATLPSREFCLPRGPERETVWTRRGAYPSRGSESDVLVVAGTFRVILERDLMEASHGDRDRLGEDLRNLERQGLVLRREVPSDDAGHRQGVVCLTREGRALLEARRSDEGVGRRQVIHSGWQKAAEVVHDASLYRMYQVEAARIERQGGTIARVVLGDELKREYLKRLNQPDAQDRPDPPTRFARAAAPCSLPVVNGHVEIPDVRVEYLTADGRSGRVDLELVTDAYHAGHIAGKRAAGFTLYSAVGGHGMYALGEPGPRAGASSPDFLSTLLSI